MDEMDFAAVSQSATERGREERRQERQDVLASTIVPVGVEQQDIGFAPGSWLPESPKPEQPFTSARMPDIPRFRSKGPIPPPDDVYAWAEERERKMVADFPEEELPQTALPSGADWWTLAMPQAKPKYEKLLRPEDLGREGIRAAESAALMAATAGAGGAGVAEAGAAEAGGSKIGKGLAMGAGFSLAQPILNVVENVGSKLVGEIFNAKGYSQADISSYMPAGGSSRETSTAPIVDPQRLLGAMSNLARDVSQMAHRGVETRGQRPMKL